LINSICKAACSALVLCLSTVSVAQSPAPEAAAKALRAATLDDLYAELTLVDTAISLNGRYVAAIARLEKEKADLLVTFDLETGERKVVQRVGFDQAGKGLLLYMLSVEWKTDDKMLVRLRVRPQDVLNFFTVSEAKISKLGDRLVAVDRTTGKSVGLLADNRNAALEGAFDLGEVRSLLPQDPQHILMEVDGFNGRSLFKVNIETGRGEMLEKPQESIVGWWLDVSGKPVVRMSITNGTIKLFRKDDEAKWRVFHKMRIKEMDDKQEYEPVGASDNPDKYYVLAAPEGRDRIGLYLYDLKSESFGEPLIENPQYDIDSARISRDGTKVLRYCYLAHVRICEFTDAKINAHMRGLRKYFEESANVYVHDASEDGNGIVLFVEGPGEPPSYYYYQKEKKDIQSIGGVRKVLNEVAHPTASVVSWTSRDGKPLSGYLTLPPGVPATAAAKLPLIVHPHGGPEARDHLTFHPWVQYFAARGYAVFQPNFRGSAGFGRAYAESGYGEWGRKMQDDITDGIRMLLDKGTADPSRMCIVGASYGGYAALAGAALTPDLYKCAVSIAGLSDLDDFIGWRKRNWGSDSEGYKYWLKAIGDPDKDAQKLREVSPVRLADKIKVPILLIHGTDDFVVPIAQSRAMKKALERNGKKTELLELEKEGHAYWQDFNEVKVLAAIDQFLWKNLGPGHGVTQAPAVVSTGK
jgi:dipeptidyl aminopeptidase/acylaminoacyl peptidase